MRRTTLATAAAAALMLVGVAGFSGTASTAATPAATSASDFSLDDPSTWPAPDSPELKEYLATLPPAYQDAPDDERQPSGIDAEAPNDLLPIISGALPSRNGAKMLRDIRSGTSSSGTDYKMVVLGSKVLFAANDGSGTGKHGKELWVSDGTAAGTKLVKDINPGTADSDPKSFVKVGSRVYFTATTAAAGRELWTTDGSAAGTKLVLDIETGGPSSSPTSLVAAGKTLYFVATKTGYGVELWKSGGTAGSTVLVRDVNPGANSGASTGRMAVVGSTVYFGGITSGAGTELWASNGTAASTRLVADVRSGSDSSSPQEIIAYKGEVYFGATLDGTTYQLFSYAGYGAVLVGGTAAVLGPYNPEYLTVAGGYLYMSGGFLFSGTEFWRTDGTEGGTIYMDLNPTICGFLCGNGSDPHDLTAVGSTLYFSANDGTHGDELFKSNGTVAGTVLVKDIYPGATGSEITDISAVGSKAYFRANTSSAGKELWTSSGTGTSTKLLVDLAPGSFDSEPGPFYLANKKVFFFADGGFGQEPWARAQ